MKTLSIYLNTVKYILYNMSKLYSILFANGRLSITAEYRLDKKVIKKSNVNYASFIFLPAMGTRKLRQF